MVTREDIFQVLATIPDPEMPISIVDLGLIEAIRISGEPGAATLEVDVLPTFVGCPALPVIENEIQRKLSRLPGVQNVRVHFRMDPPWSVDRISSEGREALRQFGISVPRICTGPASEEAETLRCPFCGSSDVVLESSFGPTRCRMIYHCESCKHPFEHLKRLSLGPVLSVASSSQS